MIAEMPAEQLCLKKHLPGKIQVPKTNSPEDFQKICIEYSLKRNNFNPNNNSPNLFINKLKRRYTHYYETI